jgi:hypothetical protein
VPNTARSNQTSATPNVGQMTALSNQTSALPGANEARSNQTSATPVPANTAVSNQTSATPLVSLIVVFPDSVAPNTPGFTLTLTGNDTNWTPGIPGSPLFTVSSGFIEAQRIDSATSATIIYSSGAAGSVTIFDPSSGNSATLEVVAATPIPNPLTTLQNDFTLTGNLIVEENAKVEGDLIIGGTIIGGGGGGGGGGVNPGEINNLAYYEATGSVVSPLVLGTNLSIADGILNATGGGGGGSGTVTQVNTGTGLTGGPITTSGTIGLNSSALAVISGVINVLAFGADPTGITDSTVAIQNAINIAVAAGGGIVFVPPGTYTVSKQGSNTYALLINSSNVTFLGAGFSTVIANTSVTGDTLVVSDGIADTTKINTVKIQSICFNPSVARNTTAPELHLPYVWNSVFKDIFFGDFIANLRGNVGTCISMGIDTSLGPEGSINACWSNICQNINAVGYFQLFKLANAVDCNFDQWWGNALAANAQPITLLGNTTACLFTNGESVNGVTGGGTSYSCVFTNGNTGPPSVNRFTNCFFDTNAGGVQLNAGFENAFTNCWFNGFNSTNPAFSIPSGSTAVNTILTGCEFVNNQAEGLNIQAGGGHMMTGCIVTTSGKNGTSPCILIGASVTGCTITGTTTTNGAAYSAGPGAAPFGLTITPGATNIVAVGNSFNPAGGVHFTSASSITVANNQ